MSVLGEWLKQLVLMVVLAILTDLLLPTKAMQKYVRMVMGLAIIAVMLTPLTPLAKRGWAEHLAAAALAEITATGPSSTDATVVAAPDASDLEQQLNRQQAEQADRNLERELRSAIASRFHTHVMSVSVAGAAAEPSHLRVLVHLDTADTAICDEVARWLQDTLAVASQQVTVTAAGRR
jgi:stage III sporulation protein AF